MLDIHSLGALGETIACRYLQMRGYRILFRNYHCPGGEIDAIALHQNYLVFVEIKTRRNENAGLPCESVTSHKKAQIIKHALSFLSLRSWHDKPCRFDVVSVLMKPREYPQISLYENAF